MITNASLFDAITVTLNPAIDRTATIPSLTPGAVNRAEAFHDTPGGKGINVASALADAGHRVAASGFLGNANDSLFETLFTKKTITDRLIRTAGETRVGIKIVDPVRQETTDLNFPGLAPGSEEVAAFHQQLAGLQAPWFALGGSLPPGLAPSFYRELIVTLKERGIKIALDTSGEPLRLALEAVPTIIKPNLHELEAVLGKRLASEEAVIRAARDLVALGIELVVVSMGKAGACFVDREHAIVARPPEIPIRSTVGAGDAMVAGILSAKIRGLPLEDCARWATAFSLKHLSRHEDKTEPPDSRVQWNAHLLNALVPKVQIDMNFNPS
jgi:1-phosphofructokinase